MTTKDKLTKADAVRFFQNNISPIVTNQFGTRDIAALRQAWNDYTDSLHKSSQISTRQYETWASPFKQKTRASR